MPNKIPIAGVAAGATGSPYLAVLAYAAKAIGNYAFTEANFAGLGKYLPGYAIVHVKPIGGTNGTAAVQISSDGGTTWKSLVVTQGTTAVVGTMTEGGVLVYLDTGTNLRVAIAAQTADVFIFPLGG